MPINYDINKEGASDLHLSPSLRAQRQDVEPVSSSPTELEGEEYQNRFKKLQQWRRQARIAQADNRTEMAVDEDFYDGIQLDPQDLQIMIERSQPPIIFNVIKNTMNWVLGTERRSRVDWRVLPRNKSGSSAAKTKTKLMKYVQDVSKGEFAKSEAFTEAACAGLGWLECGARRTDEILFIRAERWRNMWFDHLGIRMDGSDMRFVFREKWIDLDIMENLFPAKKEELKQFSEGVNSLYPYLPDDTTVTDNASELDLGSDLDVLFGGPFDSTRPRVKVIEMEYKIPQQVQVLSMRDYDTPYGALNGMIYRPHFVDHQYLVRGGYFTLTDVYKLVIRRAIWCGKTLLYDDLSPYNHNRFSFVPIFCYRRKRDNMPYGIIRDLRDPQSDLNRRRSKSLFLLSANQIVVEKTAVDNIFEFHSEIQKPDGIAVVNDGKMNNWRELKHETKVEGHTEMARDDERFIHSISGISTDTEWQTRKELSGKAINLMQNQGMTAHGVIFDNHFYALQSVGEILLSNIEQFFDQEKEIRISGDQHKDEFMEINKVMPDGSILNSITSQKADFIIGKQDYRETIRQAMTDQLMDLISNLSKLDPRIGLTLLDLVVELMDDLPNKEEAVARIRKLNGQHAPEDELSLEEKQRIMESDMKMAQEQELIKKLQQALMEVQVMEGQSKTFKNMAEAMMSKLEGFIKALEAAGTVGDNPHLVRAADDLMLEARKFGGGNGT